MQEISDTAYEDNVVLGDLNLASINWNNCTTEEGPQGFSTMFIEKIIDCFFTKHIKGITRLRGDNRASTQDLLFSSDESVVEHVYILCPLGRSDRACIGITCDVNDLEAKGKDTQYTFEKANYHQMKRSLDLNWEQYLSANLSTEEKWRKFASKLKEIIDKCVPKRRYNARQRMRKRTNRNLPMSRHLWTKIKRKQRLWRRLTELKRENREGQEQEPQEAETEYRRLNNQIRRDTRNATKLKEKEIATHVKDNPKIFWKYVSTKTRTKSRIGDLYKDEERAVRTANDKEKANTLE